MPDPNAVYEVRRSGLWNPTHRWSLEGRPIGLLTFERGASSMVRAGRWTSEEGETLLLRRDPGLLRSQFSLWTEGREWLCSSLRPGFTQRVINLETGSKPLRMMPLAGLRVGWTLQAPKTGERARLEQPFLGPARVSVYQKVELELLVMAYFLGFQLRLESLPPGPPVDSDGRVVARSRVAGS